MNTAVTPEVVAAEMAYRSERDRVTTHTDLPTRRRRTLREWLRAFWDGRGAELADDVNPRELDRLDASTTPHAKHV